MRRATGLLSLIADCSNAFSNVKGAATLAEMGMLYGSSHADSGQVFQHETSGRVISGRLWGSQNDRFLYRCPAGGTSDIVNVLSCGLRPGLQQLGWERKSTEKGWKPSRT